MLFFLSSLPSRYVLFTLFATYSMLPLPLTWAILAGLATSALHIGVQVLIRPPSQQLSTNQVRPCCCWTASYWWF